MRAITSLYRPFPLPVLFRGARRGLCEALVVTFKLSLQYDGLAMLSAFRLSEELL